MSKGDYGDFPAKPDPNRKWGEPRIPIVRLRVAEKLRLQEPLVHFDQDELKLMVEELTTAFARYLKASRDMGYFDPDEQANLLYLAGSLLVQTSLELKAEMLADGFRYMHLFDWVDPSFDDGEGN